MKQKLPNPPLSQEVLRYKNLRGEEFIFTPLSRAVSDEIKQYGKLSEYRLDGELLYHLNLRLNKFDDSINTEYFPYKISIAKGILTQGGTDDLWELCIIYNGKFRALKSNTPDSEIEEYIKWFLDYPKDDPSWFQDLPDYWSDWFDKREEYLLRRELYKKFIT